MSGELEGKVALVSGGSRGLGRAYALALAKAGAQVIALARTVSGDPAKPGSLAEVAATARAAGHKLLVDGCDNQNEADIERAVRQAIVNFSGIDILVNVAVWYTTKVETLATPLDEWSNTMTINVRAPYVFMREVVPQMIERGGGSIINITSGAAGFTRPGVGAHEGFMAYGVSKAALERLTLYFSAEFEQDNIAVNAISPGFVGRPGAAEGGYMAQGEEPDLEFWGDPLVHLAQQRPQDGFTGKIVHTYQFGRSWGPKPEQPPQWNEHIRAILRDAGINE